MPVEGKPPSTQSVRFCNYAEIVLLFDYKMCLAAIKDWIEVHLCIHPAHALYHPRAGGSRGKDQKG